jgi:hypothetical protein
MISSGDEQKHLNFGNNSLEIFDCIEPSFLRKSITIQGSLTDATEPLRVDKLDVTFNSFIALALIKNLVC